jgi:hypothetical protein
MVGSLSYGLLKISIFVFKVFPEIFVSPFQFVSPNKCKQSDHLYCYSGSEKYYFEYVWLSSILFDYYRHQVAKH